MLFCFALLAFLVSAASPGWAVFVIPGSVSNGIVDPDMEGDDESHAFDHNGLTRFFIRPAGPGEISFLIDLEGRQTVRSVALYGDPIYRQSISMLSDLIRVEAADSAAGPFSLIGVRGVGNTRPTDPDPATGGENPFTGGNGRLIPCNSTEASFLRISGQQGFDNNILIHEILINPKLVIHRMDPIHQGVPHNPLDFGSTDPFNGRAAFDCADGLFNTKTFFGLDVSLTLDLGVPTQVHDFRIHLSDNDIIAAVREGIVRTSSTDNPNNFDTVETVFDVGVNQAHGQIFLPNQPGKRYFQITFTLNSTGLPGMGTEPTYRISEIDFRTPEQAPLDGVQIVTGSIVDGIVDPDGAGSNETQATDSDYNSALHIRQPGAESRSSFVLDLGGGKEVHSVGMYGFWSFLPAVEMFSDEVIVEAGDSPTGPFTEIGSINVGNSNPTHPNPALGGANPWTGGNGRRIPCTPTLATHLRISGGYGFDANINLYEIVVNPNAVLHRVDPVDGVGMEQDLWNIGGGGEETRVGAEGVDGRFLTRVNPKQPYTFTLDVGRGTDLLKMREIRVFPLDSQLLRLPKMGVVRTSFTDDPDNMNTLQSNFDFDFIGGALIIPLPNLPEKRFVQIEFQTDQVGGTDIRIGEIEVIGEFVQGGSPPPSSSVERWEIYD